jgi:hypothetical protein
MKNEITLSQFIKSYWNYYIELEQQVWDTRRYVDFNKKNNRTFSMEYLKLLQAICSEIDVLAKVVASYIDPSFKGTNINHWGYAIQQSFSGIQNAIVMFNDDYEIQPWKNWFYEAIEKEENGKKKISIKLKAKASNPQWWTSYNKSKHERTSSYNNSCTNYERANLKHVSEALAALYILEKWFASYIFDKENTAIDMEKSILFSE